MSDRQGNATELAEFLATLKPGEPLSYGYAERHETVKRLAPHPLRDDHEAVARDLARATASANRWPGPLGRWRWRAVRRIGESLGAEGGAYLMVLVAHRAQYLHDPDWRVKRDRFIAAVRERGDFAILSAGGPLVGRIENAWDGICGWQK